MMRHTARAFLPHGSRLVTCVLALLALAACLPDKEEDFRSEVGAWISLGDTVFYNARRNCTAGVFEVRSGVIRSAMRSVTSWPEAQQEIARGRAIAFENLTVSPSEFTGAIMGEAPHIGTQFLSGGLAARNCMDAETEAYYYEALNSPQSVLLFDPESRTVGILQTDTRLLFIGRGEL